MKTHASEDTAPAAKSVKIDAGKVAKPFHTPSRRFALGADVARADLAATPLDFDSLVGRSFIKAG